MQFILIAVVADLCRYTINIGVDMAVIRIRISIRISNFISVAAEYIINIAAGLLSIVILEWRSNTYTGCVVKIHFDRCLRADARESRKSASAPCVLVRPDSLLIASGKSVKIDFILILTAGLVHSFLEHRVILIERNATQLAITYDLQTYICQRFIILNDQQVIVSRCIYFLVQAELTPVPVRIIRILKNSSFRFRRQALYIICRIDRSIFVVRNTWPRQAMIRNQNSLLYAMFRSMQLKMYFVR